ncbi:uncharacterized protein LOC128460587 [Pleuronectes platessa]|uniref:uncharacterized protein LOC128460587 n=1 Tax=Pleuronectes platessa TaxID=8262 RepID=UPI00232A4F22|nr:uncharacterized protein LOC128460587 [Pleuronectes platessa]
MSLPISDSEEEFQSSEGDVGCIPDTQAHSAEVQSDIDSDTQHQHRSTRVTHKRLAGWPIHRILEALYAKKISAPAGLNHEELFEFLSSHDNPDDEAHRSSRAANPASAPPKSKGKAPAKKRSAPPDALRPADNYTPSKKQKRPGQGPSIEATILSTLQDMKSSLNVMNTRIQTLESNATFPMANEAPARKRGEINMKHPSTPVNVPALSLALSKHPCGSFVNYLITGLVQGFLAGLCWLPKVTHVCKNLQSACKEPEVVDELLSKEVKKGYMIGPLSKLHFPIFRVSPIGIATRKYSNKKRLIIDLSAPHNCTIPSINSLIPKEPFSLFYASVDNAAQMIKLAGVGAWLGKADITDAFKVLPLHPSQWHLFCIKWKSKFYYSVKLTFGCRSSPSIFNTLSEALCWILYNSYKLPFVLHLLDDFLVIDFPSSPPARNITALRNLFSELGVPLSEEKTIGPSTRLEFLGITLDSLLMQASLPQDKLSRIRAAIKYRSTTTIISKRDLLSLLGHLNFAMRIIPHGRSFVSRLIELAYSVENLNDPVVVDEGCQSDLRFWSLLCEEWNGISFSTMTMWNLQIPSNSSPMPPPLLVLGDSMTTNGSQTSGQLKSSALMTNPNPQPFMSSTPLSWRASCGEIEFKAMCPQAKPSSIPCPSFKQTIII